MGGVPTAVLASGQGSNLRWLLEAAAAPYRIDVVIADRAAPGLRWADKHDVPAPIVDWSGYPDRRAFTLALCDEKLG